MLALNFLNNPYQVDNPKLIEILENFGKEISEYGKEYFYHIVTSTCDEGRLHDISLYILAPEISYEYKAIHVDVLNVAELSISYLTLVSKQTEKYRIEYSNGTQQYENRLREILSSSLFNISLKFLVDQILLKRSYNTEVRKKIRVGQAKVGVLHNGDRINVGFQSINGDEVTYYTGKGLRMMFKPGMSKEEQIEANRLKNLSEDELIKEGYMEKKKISDFKDIE